MLWKLAKVFRIGFAERLTANITVCVVELVVCEIAEGLNTRASTNSEPMETSFFITSAQFVSVSVTIRDVIGISLTSALAANV